MTKPQQISVGGTVSIATIRRDGTAGSAPFLLVHGLASNARLWDGVGDELQQRGHSSVAVDQRGHGQSSAVRGPFDFGTLTDDLAAVVAASFDSPVVVAGQSWGGNVALEMAARYPELVSGLGLVDGGFLALRNSFPDWAVAEEELAPPSFEGVKAAEIEERMRARLRGWPESGIRGQLANFERLDDGTIRPHLSRSDHMVILSELWRHQPDGVAGKIEVPTVVIAVDDRPHKRERVRAFSDRLGNGRVVWADGHHDIHAEKPEFVATELIRLTESRP